MAKANATIPPADTQTDKRILRRSVRSHFSVSDAESAIQRFGANALSDPDLKRDGGIPSLNHFLKDAYWWLQTAHAILRETDGREDDLDIQITQEKIRAEYFAVLSSYWRARVEVWVGRFIPVRYVHFVASLNHYVELTNLVHYLCFAIRPDLTERLETVTG